MNDPILQLKSKGYPLIEVYADHFSIKALDHWEPRRFEYHQVKSVMHLDPNDSTFMRFNIWTSLAGLLFAKDDPWKIKVVLQNGGEWSYKTAPRSPEDMLKVLDFINQKIRTA